MPVKDALPVTLELFTDYRISIAAAVQELLRWLRQH